MPQICESYAYDEFGLHMHTIKSGIQNPAQPFGYTGYQMEAVSGMYFAQARRYDAQTGRFTSEDKVRGFAGLPYTLNPYIYCWNRPVDMVDLNGLYPVAGVSAEIGSNFYQETATGVPAPTAGVSRAMGDALSESAVSTGYVSCEKTFGDETLDYLGRTLEHGKSTTLKSKPVVQFKVWNADLI